MKIVSRLSIFLILVSIFTIRCANQGSPTGGPKDTLAPQVVRITPAMYTTDFKSKRILIEFDEYVQLKDQSKLFFVSPPGTQKPRLTVKPRAIEVLFEAPLDSATTYRVDFGSSIVDNNEGNKLDGFSYVFSTGPYIDSLMMVGQTISAFERDTVVNAYIFFYDSRVDSVTVDSTLFNAKVDALFRTDSSGYFVADILKNKDYRLYAIEDKNGDQRYQAGTDRVAFVDGTFNPAKLGGFTMTYDSIARYMKIDPMQVTFELFEEIPIRRQLITKQTRPLRQKMILTFNSPNPEIDSIKLAGIDPEWIIRENGHVGDTITLWIAPPSKELIKQLVDTITGTLQLQRQDSVWTKYTSTEKLTFSHRIFDPEKDKAEKKAAQLKSNKYKKAEKLKAKNAKKAAKLLAVQKKKRAKLLAAHKRTVSKMIKKDPNFVDTTNIVAKFGPDPDKIRGMNDSLKTTADSLAQTPLAIDSTEIKAAIADSIAQKLANKLVFKVEAANPLIPVNNIRFTFDYPLLQADSTKISLIHIKKSEGKGRNAAVDTTKLDVPFLLTKHPNNIRAWQISADWKVDQEYQLTINEGAFQDITFAVNDSLGSKFTIANPDKYGQLTFKPTPNPADSTLYIYELIQGKGKNMTIIQRKAGVQASESVVFPYLPKGSYVLRIVQDVNGNGKWDTGSLTQRRPPEKARMVVDENRGRKIFLAKENWTVEETVNLIELFD